MPDEHVIILKPVGDMPDSAYAETVDFLRWCFAQYPGGELGLLVLAASGREPRWVQAEHPTRGKVWVPAAPKDVSRSHSEEKSR